MRNEFTSKVIASACPENVTSTCPSKLTEAIRSIKLYNYFAHMLEMEDAMGKHFGSNWKDVLEGHSAYYFDKIKILQEYVDDERVEVICEIGLNSGHGAINFLTTNPTARLMSFDIMLHNYTPQVINWLYEKFPTRDMLFVAGNTMKSLAALAKRHSNEGLCNIIFIDGGHTRDILINDIMTMKDLANRTYHRIIVDDLQYYPLDVTWADLLQNQSVKLVKEYANILGTPMYNWTLNTDQLGYEFTFPEVVEKWLPDAVLGVAEYNF